MPGTLIQPGAFNLGAIFAGGDRVRDAAKTAEETRLIQRAQLQAETDRKVDQAIEEAAKRRGVQGVEADTTLDPLVRALTLGKLGSDYSSATQGRLHQQEYDNRAAAVKAFTEGNPDLGNASLAGVANGPLQLTKVEGNEVIRNPYSTQGSVVANDIGNALIGAHNAAARQHDAAANLSNVKAAAGGFAPSKAGGKSGSKVTEPTQGRLAAAFAGSPALELDFLQWRSAHPEITDGNQALDAYRVEQAAHKPHIITASLPGSMTVAPPSPADRSLETNLRDDAAPADVIAKVVQAVQGGKDFDIPVGRAPANAAPVKHPAVPPAAVEYLRANPHTRALFAQKYGEAAAKSVLGE